MYPVGRVLALGGDRDCAGGTNDQSRASPWTCNCVYRTNRIFTKSDVVLSTSLVLKHASPPSQINERLDSQQLFTIGSVPSVGVSKPAPSSRCPMVSSRANATRRQPTLLEADLALRLLDLPNGNLGRVVRNFTNRNINCTILHQQKATKDEGDEAAHLCPKSCLQRTPSGPSSTSSSSWSPGYPQRVPQCGERELRELQRASGGGSPRCGPAKRPRASAVRNHGCWARERTAPAPRTASRPVWPWFPW